MSEPNDSIQLLLKTVADEIDTYDSIGRFLLYIRHLAEVYGGEKSAVWITEHEFDNVEIAMFFLASAGEDYQSRAVSEIADGSEEIASDLSHWRNRLEEVEKGSLSLKPRRTIAAKVELISGEEQTIGYCHTAVDFEPQFPRECSLALGSELHRVRHARCVKILRNSMNQLRTKVIDKNRAESETFIEANKRTTEVFEEIVQATGTSLQAAFPRLAIISIARSVSMWRNKAAQDSRSVVLSQSNGRSVDYSYELKSNMSAAVLARLSSLDSIFFSHEDTNGQFLSPDDELLESCSISGHYSGYFRAVPLHTPSLVDELDGLPFIGVLILLSAGDYLTRPERDAIGYYINAVAQTIRLHERLSLDHAEDMLSRNFAELHSAEQVAEYVAKFLSTWFSATEVAVLERRGNFLALIAAEKVPIETLPPLHIDGESIASSVVRSGMHQYSDDVWDINRFPNYLKVVAETRTQWTVPLEWTNERVGCLLIGLGVIDALTNSDRETIEALSAHCSQVISSIRRSSEMRAIIHRLKDNLPTAISKLKLAKRGDFSQERQLSLIDHAARILTVTRDFVSDFSMFDSGLSELFDLIETTKNCLSENEELLGQPDEHPVAIKITIQPHPTPLSVCAKKQSFRLALGHIVQNAKEAIRSSPLLTNNGHSIEINFSIQKEFNNPLGRELKFAVVSLCDDGPGLSDEEEMQVFDLFFSRYTDGSHLGGGLNIAKRAMECFGGKLTFRNNGKDGRGATFSLWLPMPDEKEK